jgi:hypothetical protein
VTNESLKFGRTLLTGALVLLFWGFVNPCAAQIRNPLCNGGDNQFQASYHTGVGVSVGSGHSGGLSTRVCEAEITWEDQKLVVAEQAAQIDLDQFGVNPKDEGPMAAFQVRPSKNKCCSAYQIYSLDKPPRLLRSITGGGTFSAADTDLDGRIEIWSEDLAAVDGFDGLFASEMNYLPTYVIRFEHGQLSDATPEFQDYFDRIVAALRIQMDPESLKDFKQSDGVLRVGSIPDAARFHRLRLVKVQVLEIVWAYLTSGREQEAWSSLQNLWPERDANRVRAAITSARDAGIYSQIDAKWAGAPRVRKKQAPIFKQIEVTPAQAIHLWRPALTGVAEPHLPEAEVVLDLVIDAAGKVYAVELSSDQTADEGLLAAAKEWKFIPAFKNGYSVASQLRLITSPKR